jgi:hypothetical protein
VVRIEFRTRGVPNTLYELAVELTDAAPGPDAARLARAFETVAAAILRVRQGQPAIVPE